MGLKNTLIHQRQIPVQHWGAVKSPSKTAEEGKTVDTIGEENGRKIKEKVIFLTGVGEATNP